MKGTIILLSVYLVASGVCIVGVLADYSIFAYTAAVLFVLLSLFFLIKKKRCKMLNSDILKDTKILLADDTVEIRQFICIVLKKMGAKMTCCCSGSKAVQEAMKEKFDIVLLDLNMPGVDGYETARQIRASKLNKGTYMFILTASGLLDLGDKHIKAGFDDYIEKPVSPETLVRKIKLALLKKQQIELVDKGELITSNYSDDPDYRKTIETFLENLPAKIEQIQKDFQAGNMTDVSSKIHSLKGLGGMAGFPVISSRAESIEKIIDDDNVNDQVEKLRREINELILICQKIKVSK